MEEEEDLLSQQETVGRAIVVESAESLNSDPQVKKTPPLLALPSFKTQLTKYTAPKLPWPISRRSEKSFSGSSLKKSSATSGSFRLPARPPAGMMAPGGPEIGTLPGKSR